MCLSIWNRSIGQYTSNINLTCVGLYFALCFRMVTLVEFEDSLFSITRAWHFLTTGLEHSCLLKPSAYIPFWWNASLQLLNYNFNHESNALRFMTETFISYPLLIYYFSLIIHKNIHNYLTIMLGQPSSLLCSSLL